MGIIDRLQHAWNAFMNRDPTPDGIYLGMPSSYNPTRIHLTGGNERTILSSIITRIAMDAAAVDICHVKTDSEGRLEDIIDDELNRCFTIEANLDQTSRAFWQDVYVSLLDEGCIAIVPIDLTVSPKNTDSYKINTMRVGKVTQWYPKHVTVDVYDEKTGRHREMTVPKKFVSIIENPMYPIMNEPNSIFKRLSRKLALLDRIDEAQASKKLNIIIQLPYPLKGELNQQRAEQRLKSIEEQLRDSDRGIAYIDATEKVVQLNRPIENQLLEQIEYLTKQLYNALSMDETILNHTATESAMNSYQTRIIEPLISSVVCEMRRKFLTKTAISQHHSIMFFRDPFKLIPVTQVADISDKLSRNEILSANEIRQSLGRRPSKDPHADELHNSNMPRYDDSGVAGDVASSGESLEDFLNKPLSEI